MATFNEDELKKLRESTILAIHNDNNSFSLLYDSDSPEQYKKLLYGVSVLLGDVNFCKDMITVADDNEYVERVTVPTFH